MAKYGFVYCLSNYSMRGLYKIGHTFNSPHQRAEDLSRSTGVPEEFCVVGYIEVENPRYWEAEFHRRLARFRHNKKREFFACRLSDIGPLFLRNEHALCIYDCDFAPGMYQEGFRLEDLPNPYEEARSHLRLIHEAQPA